MAIKHLFGKPDANQKAIIKWIREKGYQYQITSGIGGDFPDILICYFSSNHLSWINLLIEVKVPGKELSKGQRKFFELWKGPKCVVHSEEELERYLKAN